MYVNANWSEEIGDVATDNYYNPSKTVTRYVGADAAKTIDNAISYLLASTETGHEGEGMIELTENASYKITQALGTTENGVTNMTLQSRVDNPDLSHHATVSGTVDAGKATTLKLDHLSIQGSVLASTEAASTLTFNYSSVSGNVTGNGTVVINGVSATTETEKKVSTFSGTTIAAGGTLTVNGGIITVRDLVGGKVNASAAGATSVTINGANDMTYVSSTIYGGSIVTSGGNVTQSEAASVTVDVSGTKKATLTGGIYAGGQVLSGGTMNVSGNRTVTFTGLGSNLGFTGRVSGGVQGSGTKNVSGTATLVFNSFNGKFNGSISDFNTITVTGATQLQLGRRQTLTGSTGLTFAITDTTTTTDGAMYTLRASDSWEFSKTITVAQSNTASTGIYTLVGNAGGVNFGDFTFSVAGQSAALGTVYEDANHNKYMLTYADNKLTLNYTKATKSLMMGSSSAPQTPAVDAIGINDTLAGANATATKITGVADLKTDTAGAKNLGSVSNILDSYEVDGTSVATNGEATQIAGSDTVETGDDVWAKLTSSNGSLIVSWGKTQDQVNGALNAYDANDEVKSAGFTLAATDDDLEDNGIENSDYTKKDNGKLA